MNSNITSNSLDKVVNALESKLIPELENKAIQLKKRFPNSIFETASYRVANEVHTLGLRCGPSKSTSRKDRFSLHVNVFCTNGISLRGFVGWNDSYTDSAGSGHTYYEAMTKSYENVTKASLNGFYGELPNLYAGLTRALRRGHPPSRLERFWNRLTHRCD